MPLYFISSTYRDHNGKKGLPFLCYPWCHGSCSNVCVILSFTPCCYLTMHEHLYQLNLNPSSVINRINIAYSTEMTLINLTRRYLAARQITMHCYFSACNINQKSFYVIFFIYIISDLLI